MKARVIFINEKEMQATSNQYALASSVCNDHFGDVYLKLDDVVDFIQTSQNACAEEMIKEQEKLIGNEKNVEVSIMSPYHAEWRTYNYILSELKKYQNK